MNKCSIQLGRLKLEIDIEYNCDFLLINNKKKHIYQYALLCQLYK